MRFLESLPEGCPPADSHDDGCETAFRLVPSPTPKPADFASYAALQEALPVGVDPCRWASCSLFLDLPTIEKKRLAIKKLRKYPFAAQLKIVPGSGRIRGNSHIDFWMYDTFDPISAICGIVEL